MIIPAPEPVAFQILGISIYWYGILMAIAIFVGVVIANCLFNKYNPECSRDLILSDSPIFIIFGILGARLYFCLVNLPYYIKHPLEILDFRQGGLSIHGALIFGILALIFYAHRKKVSVYKFLDCLACATFLGQFIGRWGNYFNSEAYGLPVADQNWGLFVPEESRVAEFIDYQLFHPTFLYESVLNLIGFVILLFVLKHFNRKYTGMTFFMYLILYSVIRFFVEHIRVDSALNLGIMPIAQIISVVCFCVGIFGVIAILINQKRRDN